MASEVSGIPVGCDGECLAVHSAAEAPVPMEVDPTCMPGISLSGDLELGSKPSYAVIAAGVWTMAPPPSVPMQGSRGLIRQGYKGLFQL